MQSRKPEPQMSSRKPEPQMSSLKPEPQMSSRKPEGLSGIQKNRPSYKGRFFICEVTEFRKLLELYVILSSEET